MPRAPVKPRGRLKLIHQMERTDCGAVCLAMVLRAFGRRAEIRDLRRACGVGRDGVSVFSLASVARDRGLEVQALSASAVQLTNTDVPAILYWGFNHFVVLAKTGRRGLLIYDPSAGERWITIAEANRWFTGVALTFKDSKALVRGGHVERPRSRYLLMFLAATSSIVFIIAASAIVQTLSMAVPMASKVFFDLVLKPEQSPLLTPVAAALLVAIVARALIAFLRGWAIHRLEYVVDARIITQYVRHLLELPFEFLMQRSPGELLRRVQDSVSLRDAVASRFASLALDSVLFIACAATMLAFDPLVAGVALAITVARIFVFPLAKAVVAQATVQETAAAAREMAALTEALSAPEITKGLALEGRFLRRVMTATVERLGHMARRRSAFAWSGAIGLLLDGCAYASVVWLGGVRVADGSMTVGTFCALLALRALFAVPLEHLAAAALDLQMLRRHQERLDDVLDSPTERGGGRQLRHLHGAVKFSAVSYRYTTRSPWALREVSFEVAAGERIAVVGPSGAGKSTLVKLILGVLESTSGRIQVDGQDLDRLCLRDLRRCVGVSPQSPFFFDATLRWNLTLGDAAIADTTLMETMEMVCLGDFLRGLPEGLDTGIGRGGVRLSGGERQRLALARALLRRPGLLILDEATASLDIVTERRIHDALAQLPTTQIVICHRLGFARQADRILVVESGRIVEQGNYDTLMGQPGPFRRLASAEARGP